MSFFFLAATPTSGPYEQTAIRRKDGGRAPATQARSGAVDLRNRWDMSKVPLALGGVIVLILGMRWLGKKMMPGAKAGRSSRAVQVLVRSPLSARQQLMLVQIGRRLVLVGSSGSEMSPLCQIDDPLEVAEVLGQIREDKNSTVAKTFGSLIGRAEKAYEPQPPDPPDAEAQPQTEMMREELTELMERARRISKQFQGS